MNNRQYLQRLLTDTWHKEFLFDRKVFIELVFEEYKKLIRDRYITDASYKASRNAYPIKNYLFSKITKGMNKRYLNNLFNTQLESLYGTKNDSNLKGNFRIQLNTQDFINKFRYNIVVKEDLQELIRKDLNTRIQEYERDLAYHFSDLNTELFSDEYEFSELVELSQHFLYEEIGRVGNKDVSRRWLISHYENNKSKDTIARILEDFYDITELDNPNVLEKQIRNYVTEVYKDYGYSNIHDTNIMTNKLVKEVVKPSYIKTLKARSYDYVSKKLNKGEDVRNIESDLASYMIDFNYDYVNKKIRDGYVSLQKYVHSKVNNTGHNSDEVFKLLLNEILFKDSSEVSINKTLNKIIKQLDSDSKDTGTSQDTSQSGNVNTTMEQENKRGQPNKKVLKKVRKDTRVKKHRNYNVYIELFFRELKKQGYYMTSKKNVREIVPLIIDCLENENEIDTGEYYLEYFKPMHRQTVSRLSSIRIVKSDLELIESIMKSEIVKQKTDKDKYIYLVKNFKKFRSKISKSSVQLIKQNTLFDKEKKLEEITVYIQTLIEEFLNGNVNNEVQQNMITDEEERLRIFTMKQVENALKGIKWTNYDFTLYTKFLEILEKNNVIFDKNFDPLLPENANKIAVTYLSKKKMLIILRTGKVTYYLNPLFLVNDMGYRVFKDRTGKIKFPRRARNLHSDERNRTILVLFKQLISKRRVIEKFHIEPIKRESDLERLKRLSLITTSEYKEKYGLKDVQLRYVNENEKSYLQLVILNNKRKNKVIALSPYSMLNQTDLATYNQVKTNEGIINSHFKVLNMLNNKEILPKKSINTIAKVVQVCFDLRRSF